MWTYNNELYHYGVIGMKWGVRKREPRTAKQYQRALNRTEQKIAGTKYDYDESVRTNDRRAKRMEKRLTRMVDKANKYNKQNKDRKAAHQFAKAYAKSQKYNKALARDRETDAYYKARYDKAVSYSNTLLKNAKAAGYTVSSKKVLRNATRGRFIAATLLSGNPTIASRYVNLVDSKKYKVKDK